MIERVDIIITTRNRIQDLLFTIRHMIGLGFEQNQFYILDDASSDDTQSILLHEFSKVNFKRNEHARGYIHNRNILMSWTNKDFVLSLDDDSHIREKKDLEDALTLLESDPSFGIFGFHAFEQLESPPSRSSLPHTIRKVRSYIGCGHIIKRKIISLLGNYKEEFEFYCEEIDYSLRAFQNGYFVVTQDNIVVHHRIDWNLRSKQKADQQSKGVYGAVWRSSLGFSNHLAIRSLYYPFPYDLLHILICTSKRCYRFALKKSDYKGFINGLLRFVALKKFIAINKNKLSIPLFKEWMKQPPF